MSCLQIPEFWHSLGREGQSVLAAHEELTRSRVLAVLEDLGTQGASGVLEVAGKPSGAIYLDSGHITFARASWIPDLATRLRGIRQVPPDLQASLAALGTDGAAIAAQLMRCGHLTAEELHGLIRSIVIDAFLVLAIPLAVDSHVAAIRFASTRTYWSGTFPRLDIGSVRGEATRRADRMAEYGLAPTTAVALRDLRLPAAILTREQWVVACRIGDRATARELAVRCGTALADTVECLGSLIGADLCTPVRASTRRQLPSGAVGQPPPADVLRQVLNGLRNLS